VDYLCLVGAVNILKRSSLIRERVFFRVLPLNWTVGMAGILAGTVEDAAIALVTTPSHTHTQTVLLLWEIGKSY
jgi:hypothetical protein